MKTFLLLLFLIPFSGSTQDYTTYNNLTETAKKFILAERYFEAHLIFEQVENYSKDLYRPEDLYYWALALGKLKREEEAIIQLKRACKLPACSFNILYGIKYEGEFNWLSKEQINELEQLSINNEETLEINSELDSLLSHYVKIDNYWTAFLTDSIQSVYEPHESGYDSLMNIYNNHALSNRRDFCLTIQQYGFPKKTKSNISIQSILYHMNLENWNSIEPQLEKALKAGDLLPVDYIYTWFRTHDEDRYSFPSHMGFDFYEEREEIILLKERTTLGLGL
jgi:hypothetical protein